MKIHNNILQNHIISSPTWSDLVRYAACRDRSDNTVDFPFKGQDVEDFRLLNQAWPTLVGGRQLEIFKKATVGLSKLTTSIPERFFDNDRDRLIEFLGFGEELARFVPAFPVHFGAIPTRCDFIVNAEGSHCLELNVGVHLGGWQSGLWEKNYRESSLVSGFLASNARQLYYRDPIKAMFLAMIRDAWSLIRDKRLTIGVFRERIAPEQTAGYMNQILPLLIRSLKLDLEAEVISFSNKDPLTYRDSCLRVGDREVQVVIETEPAENRPELMMRAFDEGNVRFSSRWTHHFMSNKLFLALLSTHEQSPTLSPEERSLIRKFVPWSRVIKAGEVDYHGRQIDLHRLLVQERDHLVLKRGRSSSGAHVVVGRHTSQDVWETRVEEAFAEGVWMVQDYVETPRHLYADDRGNPAHHGLVWGTFAFGDLYGGAWARMIAGDDIINFNRGATHGIVFEVVNEEEEPAPTISPEGRETYANLSAQAADFLDFVAECPECQKPYDFREVNMPGVDDQHRYPLQPWPLLIGSEKLAELERAAVATTRLVKSIPERIFENDPKRIASFYRVDEPGFIELLLSEPNGIDGALCRGDFIDSGNGLKCLEVNINARLGGWEMQAWEDRFLAIDYVRRFNETRGLEPKGRFTLRVLFEHVLADAAGKTYFDGNTLNIAIVGADEGRAVDASYFDTVYADVRAASAVQGSVVACMEEDLEERVGDLYCNGVHIHVVIDQLEQFPRLVFRLSKRGRVGLYNTPFGDMLSDKRNLALLSQWRDSDVFND